MDISILMFNDFANNNWLKENFDEEKLVNYQFLLSRQKFSQIKDYGEDVVVNESSIVVNGMPNSEFRSHGSSTITSRSLMELKSM
jgi:hypothetical protein